MIKNGREASAQLIGVNAGLLQQRQSRSALLIKQGQQYVGRLDLGVVASNRCALRVSECLLKAAGEFVLSHVSSSSSESLDFYMGM